MELIQLNNSSLGKYDGIWVSGVCPEDAGDMIELVLTIINCGGMGVTWEVVDIDGKPVLQRIRI